MDSKVKTYSCGTLTYTKATLAALFAWLLWGDFCLTIMESVIPSVLPLKLKSLDAPNWLIGVIMATLPGILNMTICPWVSFKSDRYRSRWGRRIPFILWTIPFLCVCLVMLGFCEEISSLVRNYSPAMKEYAPATVTIGVIAIFMVLFQFFNMFVGSVFAYLFNDVVPPQFLGRFIGMFRMTGTAAGALYNYFIFKYAETHMREIFTGTALLYFVGLGMMCLLVREGNYPPIEGETDKDNKGWGGIKTFLKESFSMRFYWMRFLYTACATTAGSVGVFCVFFNKEMGLTLDDIGKISAISSIAMMAATYFMAIFIDRWHPLRICVYGAVFGVVGYAMSFVWIFVTLPGSYFFWLNLGSVLIATFFSAILGVAGFPCEMRIFPQSRFGQFCSAQALVRSFFTTVGGLVAGLFIDMFKWIFNGSDFAYRFIYLWMAIFAAASALFLVLVYMQWNSLGGDKHFHPPAPWNPKGYEELPIVKTVGPASKWLKISLRLFDGIMALSALGIPCFMFWMYSRGQFAAFRGFAFIVLPLSVGAWALWIMLKKRIKADMDLAASGRPPVNGIPHHGMLIITSSKFLLALGLWVAQVVAACVLGLESGAVVFGVANAATNFLLVGAIWLLCRVERGYSTQIDVSEDLPAAT